MISSYRGIITRELPIRNGYGQSINEPEEVEIGVLYYLDWKKQSENLRERVHRA